MRNIPDDNLAYPILIKFDTGSTGSGFLLRTDIAIFLVTAKHVLFKEENKEEILRGKNIELICQTKDLEDENIVKYSIELEKLSILKHTIADVAVIKLGLIDGPIQNNGSCSIKYSEGVNRSGQGITVSVDAQNSTKLLKDVLISNDIFLYGYPTSLGLETSPQFNYIKPLLRKGIIANTYKDRGTIILDCPVYYGNSGGPIVEVEQNGDHFLHKVIGVVSQFIPFEEKWLNTKNGLVNTELSNSGYSVAVSMDRVFELIDYKK